MALLLAVTISVFCPEYCCGLRGVKWITSSEQKQVSGHGRSEFISCLYFTTDVTFCKVFELFFFSFNLSENQEYVLCRATVRTGRPEQSPALWADTVLLLL